MNSPRSRPFFALLLALMAGAASAQPDVALTAAAVKQAEIEAATVAPLRLAPRVRAYATVLDPAPLFALIAELEALAASAEASQAEAARSARLLAADEAVSRKTSEAATAIARTDAARLAAARRRIGLEWGPGLAALPPRERASLLTALAEGRAALVRLGFSGRPPATAEITLDIEGATVPLRVLGRAASSDAASLGPSLLASVASRELQPGRAFAVTVAGLAQQGQLVPAAAVLTDTEGRYVYVESTIGHYRRQPVQVLDERAEGVFVSGPGADARIVLRNAAAIRWASTATKAD